MAEFETSDEVLADLTKKYADFKGIGLYKLLDKSQYTLPASVVLEKDKAVYRCLSRFIIQTMVLTFFLWF